MNTTHTYYRIQCAEYDLPKESVDYSGTKTVSGIWVRGNAFDAIADLLWQGTDEPYSADCIKPELWLVTGSIVEESWSYFVIGNPTIVAKFKLVEVLAALQTILRKENVKIEHLDELEDVNNWDDIAKMTIDALMM